MKTGKMLKLGISMLVVLMAIGTVSAFGGSSYYSAEEINVPDGDIEIWCGWVDNGSDWYKFDANNGDDVYIEMDPSFLENGGEIKLHNSCLGDIEAWLSSSHSDHWTMDVAGNPQPRIEIIAGSQFDYCFIAGRNV